MRESDLIRKAAQRLREVATQATPGPWQVDGPWWHDGPKAIATGMVSGGGEERRAVLVVPPRVAGDDDARFAATLNPLVAVAVADLLDAAADGFRRPHPIARMALAVARAVLGEPEGVAGD